MFPLGGFVRISQDVTVPKWLSILLDIIFQNFEFLLLVLVLLRLLQRLEYT